MDRFFWIAAYRIAMPITVIVAMIVQIRNLQDQDVFKPWNFFSFFTIQSNLFACAVLLIGGVMSRKSPSERPGDMFRGAAVLYMTITGIVYGTLLTGYQVALQTHIPWVDNTLHRIMPLVMIIDWLLVPPRGRIAIKRAAIWLIYPLAYGVYSLIRGPIVDWYPYPFLDPDHVGGYGIVTLYMVGIAIGTALMGWALIAIGARVRLSIGPPA